MKDKIKATVTLARSTIKCEADLDEGLWAIFLFINDAERRQKLIERLQATHAELLEKELLRRSQS